MVVISKPTSWSGKKKENIKIFPTETLMLATQMRNQQKKPGNMAHSKHLDILQNHLPKTVNLLLLVYMHAL